MDGLRVSELAARAGVPPSTVRFYERAGLLRPARRAANGYRMFDESAVDDLALIGRARGAGMRLEDAAGVIGSWREGSCASLRDRLRAHLTTELTRTGERIADLAAFRRKLEAMLGRLPADDAASDRCEPGCGCDSVLGSGARSGHAPGDITETGDVSETGDAPNTSDALKTSDASLPRDGSLPGCSLGEAALGDRMSQWRALAATAESAERTGDTMRLILDPASLPSVATLVAAESDCCPSARFTLEVTAGQAHLTAEIPGLAEAGAATS